jgi:hypothetical protein
MCPSLRENDCHVVLQQLSNRKGAYYHFLDVVDMNFMPGHVGCVVDKWLCDRVFCESMVFQQTSIIIAFTIVIARKM